MTGKSPRISSDSFLIQVSPSLLSVPVHITITQLLPSTSFLLHVTTNNSARLGDSLVVGMPRGNDVVSSRLEGLARLDDDMDRLARLLGFMTPSTFDLLIAKRLGRQCFVSGDFGGIPADGKGEVLRILSRVVEQKLQPIVATS